ncbi:MAG: preprotein translocase subunit SecG [Cryomorphaceae bacterium]|jgi:preprotein translocase subunit SecG|nr:preprotein translocase subunit SecG [Cryomorphaceae bacterium]
MEVLLSTLVILASILLIAVVYMQNPKGGGLSSEFGGAQQIGGVQKTNDFIVKATWVLAGIIMVCSVFMQPSNKKQNTQPEMNQQQQQQTPAQNAPQTPPNGGK